jgi:hypothetical protein
MDIDEVDGVLERFIRQKYETKTLSSESQPASRQHTGSTGSSEDRAAPLPPKPNKRFTFGLRSSSSTFSLSRSDRHNMQDSIEENGSASRRRSPSVRKNKPSKIFGADIGGSRQDNYELKLIALREMGFPDDKRNLVILKGEGGNVDKAVATLIRLGEGSRLSSGRSSPAPDTPPKDDTSPTISGNKSSNPFDRLDLNDKALPPPPIEEISQRHFTNQANQAAYNPFLQPSQAQLEQSFQGLTVAQPSNLFPNTTGGYSNSHLPLGTNPFLQTYTPPPQIQAHGPFAAPPSFAPQTSFDQYESSAALANNPFMQQSMQPQYQSINPFGMQQNNNMAQHNSAGYAAQQTPTYAPAPNAYNQFPSASPSNVFHTPNMTPSFSPQNSSPPVYGQQQIGPGNPFLQNHMVQTYPSNIQTQFTPSGMVQSPMTQSPTQQAYPGNPFTAQYTSQAQTQAYSQSIPAPMRVDKASILALYQLQGSTQQNQDQAVSQGNMHLQDPRRSVTMPLPITTPQQNPAAPMASNPFLSAINAQSASMSVPALNQQPQNPALSRVAFGHVSHESADFSTMMNGRHSPDAFAGLSARLAR